MPFVPMMAVMGVPFLAACRLSAGRLPLDPDDAGGGTAANWSDDGGHVGSAGGRLSGRLPAVEVLPLARGGRIKKIIPLLDRKFSRAKVSALLLAKQSPIHRPSKPEALKV